MHHYKAPHDYFENADRYESYLADIDIPELETLWKEIRNLVHLQPVAITTNSSLILAPPLETGIQEGLISVIYPVAF